MNTTIHTTIPEETYNEIKEKKLAFNDLIKEGLISFNGFPEMMKKQAELEDKNKELKLRDEKKSRIIETLQKELFELQEKKNE